MMKPKRTGSKPPVAAKPRPRTKRAYTFEVALLSGPMTEDFAGKNRKISRTIEALGHHTLADLHDAIFKAFERDDEHLYEFQFGGKRPMDPRARRYGPPLGMVDPFGERDGSADAKRTTLDSLGLSTGVVFAYWFDFGDDWLHQVRVLDIADSARRGGPPRVTQRVGASPPQYPDWDDEA